MIKHIGYIIIWLFILGLSLITPITFAKDWYLPGVNIVTRQDWWVDETIRFSNLSYAKRQEWLKSKSAEEMKKLEETNLDEFFDKQKTQYEKDTRNEYLKTNYPDEQILDTIVYKYNNNNLKRVQSYHYNKTKIIVHHTAGDTSIFTWLQSVINYLQDIYKYHTLKQWRWDIWYNFLIDVYGNIYEGRAGWDSVVWAHDSRNNIPSIWISLMWNFDKQKPTQEQIKSLITLTTALTKKYNIDPTTRVFYHKAITEFPYLQSTENYTIAWHKDAWVTSCPGKNLYSLLPELRQLVMQNLAKWVLLSYSSKVSDLPLAKTIINQTGSVASPTKTVITTTKTTTTTTNTSNKNNKISAKISLDQAKKYMLGNISVLLYDLSISFTKRDISCDGECKIESDNNSYYFQTWSIEIAEWWLLLSFGDTKQLVSSIKISSNTNGLVKITNYNRVSYYKIPRNTFHGSINISMWKLKNIKTNTIDDQYIVVNTLPFDDYMNWIVETTDTEHPEKIKVMWLLSKSYALFYMNSQNKHPSIPDWVIYTAIDNPYMFQKYVWAGLEKTLKKVPKIQKEIKNQIVIYSGFIPILPYFNCSNGNTISAKTKWWWTDTPYLQARKDVAKCDKYNGHGVWLSGKWAQYLATKWMKYKDIIKYYYQWVEIKSY